MAGTLAIGAVGVGGLLYFCPGPEVEGALPDWPVGHLGFVGLKVAVMKLYSVECFRVTVLLILYLLYALLVCAHVVSKYSGALRNFN